MQKRMRGRWIEPKLPFPYLQPLLYFVFNYYQLFLLGANKNKLLLLLKVRPTTKFMPTTKFFTTRLTRLLSP